jgi:hypothetical protein
MNAQQYLEHWEQGERKEHSPLPPVSELGDLVKTWRAAARGWRNHPAKASETRYEDGLAEAFDRCADMLDNRLCVGPTNRSQSWWCKTCKTYVSGRDVTYDETHDIRSGGCGDKVA